MCDHFRLLVAGRRETLFTPAAVDQVFGVLASQGVQIGIDRHPAVQRRLLGQELAQFVRADKHHLEQLASSPALEIQHLADEFEMGGI